MFVCGAADRSLRPPRIDRAKRGGGFADGLEFARAEDVRMPGGNLLDEARAERGRPTMKTRESDGSPQLPTPTKEAGVKSAIDRSILRAKIRGVQPVAR